MKKTTRNEKTIRIHVLLMGMLMIMPFCTFAFDEGVPVGQAGIVRQEITPFVPLNQNLVLDPARGGIVLLFPPGQVKRQIERRPDGVGPEVTTQGGVIRKSRSETETRTITIKNLPK